MPRRPGSSKSNFGVEAILSSTWYPQMQLLSFTGILCSSFSFMHQHLKTSHLSPKKGSIYWIVRHDDFPECPIFMVFSLSFRCGKQHYRQHGYDLGLWVQFYLLPSMQYLLMCILAPTPIILTAILLLLIVCPHLIITFYEAPNHAIIGYDLYYGSNYPRLQNLKRLYDCHFTFGAFPLGIAGVNCTT